MEERQSAESRLNGVGSRACGDMSLKDKEGRSRSSEVGDHLLKAVIGGPLKTTHEVAQELGFDQSTAVCHLEKMRKMKKLKKCVKHELS
ncbi:hypothetical protein RB195_005546 [Necator americanus]|uniref:HTH iclR-type domain-containing protein n=1 Tax=Necator americanus TaxID=51031 RepID=A0ABR1BNE4_NECAM